MRYKKVVSITIPKSELGTTDRLRGDTPRSVYVRKALVFYNRSQAMKKRSQSEIVGRIQMDEVAHTYKGAV